MTGLVGSTSHSPEQYGAMDRIIWDCHAVEEEAVRWMHNVPPEWRYRTVA